MIFNQKSRKMDIILVQKIIELLENVHRKYARLSQLQILRPLYLKIFVMNNNQQSLHIIDFYIIRTGEGSFLIFDEKIFPSSYLKFDIENVIEIGIEECNGYDNLKTHLKKMFLKLMHLKI